MPNLALLLVKHSAKLLVAADLLPGELLVVATLEFCKVFP